MVSRLLIFCRTLFINNNIKVVIQMHAFQIEPRTKVNPKKVDETELCAFFLSQLLFLSFFFSPSKIKRNGINGDKKCTEFRFIKNDKNIIAVMIFFFSIHNSLISAKRLIFILYNRSSLLPK